MSSASTGGYSRASANSSNEGEVSGWTGWVFFGGVMAILLGSFQIIEGLTALYRHTYYAVGQNGLLIKVNYTTWGWVHFFLGVLIVATGFGVLVGQTWARILGVFFASVSAIFNLAFIAAYPVWSIIIIAFDVFVIYALAVHGGELRNPD